MSEIKHTSLKAELLYLIGRATTPLSCADLYDKCELAEEVSKVAKALANLQSDGKIVRLSGEGRARYQLADGVAAPAPAGKTGRSKAVQADDAARATPAAAPTLEIPTLGDPGISLEGAAGKTRRAIPVGGASAPMAEPVAGEPAPTKANVTEMFVDHLTEAGKIAEAMLAKSRDSLTDAILAKLRKQLSEQAVHSELLEATSAPTIHIHIEQVDIHLGGL